MMPRKRVPASDGTSFMFWTVSKTSTLNEHFGFCLESIRQNNTVRSKTPPQALPVEDRQAQHGTFPP